MLIRYTAQIYKVAQKMKNDNNNNNDKSCGLGRTMFLGSNLARHERVSLEEDTFRTRTQKLPAI